MATKKYSGNTVQTHTSYSLETASGRLEVSPSENGGDLYTAILDGGHLFEFSADDTEGLADLFHRLT